MLFLSSSLSFFSLAFSLRLNLIGEPFRVVIFQNVHEKHPSSIILDIRYTHFSDVLPFLILELYSTIFEIPPSPVSLQHVRICLFPGKARGLTAKITLSHAILRLRVGTTCTAFSRFSPFFRDSSAPSLSQRLAIAYPRDFPRFVSRHFISAIKIAREC